MYKLHVLLQHIYLSYFHREHLYQSHPVLRRLHQPRTFWQASSSLRDSVKTLSHIFFLESLHHSPIRSNVSVCNKHLCKARMIVLLEQLGQSYVLLECFYQ